MTASVPLNSETHFATGRNLNWVLAAVIIWAVAAFGQSNQQPPIDREEVARRTLTTVWKPRVIRDIEYARAGNISLQLDLYLPGSQSSHPLIVWIHGGAFLGGDKARIFWTPLPGLTERGYAVASINYRLSGQANFPALVHDAKAAIRWLRANAAKYDIAGGVSNEVRAIGWTVLTGSGRICRIHDRKWITAVQTHNTVSLPVA